MRISRKTDRLIEADAHFRKGIALIGLGEYTSAIDEYTKAVALNPALAEAYQHRGVLYMIMRRPKEGHVDLTIAKRLRSQVAGETAAIR